MDEFRKQQLNDAIRSTIQLGVHIPPEIALAKKVAQSEWLDKKTQAQLWELIESLKLTTDNPVGWDYSDGKMSQVGLRGFLGHQFVTIKKSFSNAIQQKFNVEWYYAFSKVGWGFEREATSGYLTGLQEMYVVLQEMKKEDPVNHNSANAEPVAEHPAIAFAHMICDERDMQDWYKRDLRMLAYGNVLLSGARTDSDNTIRSFSGLLALSKFALNNLKQKLIRILPNEEFDRQWHVAWETLRGCQEHGTEYLEGLQQMYAIIQKMREEISKQAVPATTNPHRQSHDHSDDDGNNSMRSRLAYLLIEHRGILLFGSVILAVAAPVIGICSYTFYQQLSKKKIIEQIGHLKTLATLAEQQSSELKNQYGHLVKKLSTVHPKIKVALQKAITTNNNKVALELLTTEINHLQKLAEKNFLQRLALNYQKIQKLR